MTTAAKRIYFASDFHLGVPTHKKSLEREKVVVNWLKTIKSDCEALYLMGDLFDFWFEYKSVVPKGFIRLLGTLADFTDSGIPIYFYTGNHDLWMKDYLTTELNIQIVRHPTSVVLKGKKFYLAHGDGMGPGDHGFKWMKKVFTNPICQWLFSKVHPNIAFAIANYFSQKSRYSHQENDKKFLGEEKEWLIIYSKELLKQQHFDYLVFGHRHLPLKLSLQNNVFYVNLGDWITYFTYGVFDGNQFELKNFNPIP